MQKTTSLPEAPAVAAPSAASTNPWLSGANPLFRLPGNAPFSQQPQTPTLYPSPWEIVLPAAPRSCRPFAVPLPRHAFPAVPPPGEADARSAPIFPKKRRLFFRHSCLKKTHCSPTQHSLPPNPCPSLSQALHLPQNASGLPPPSPCPCPRRAFPAVPPHSRVRRVSPPSHAPGASPKK